MKTKITGRAFARLIAVGLLLYSIGAQAENITYHVDRSFDGAPDWGTGAIVGTIETDGTIGPLKMENIESWSFEIFDGTDVVVISSSAKGFLQGEAWEYLSASETELTFDFDGTLSSELPQSYISFHGGVSDSIDYNLLGNFVGKVEQLVHQFGTLPDNGEHRVDSPERNGLVVIAQVDRPETDCSAPSVSLGEVMAGFQAGLTAGGHAMTGPTAEYFLSFGGESRRGFIIPENIIASDQCENDFILISGFVASGFQRADGTRIRTPKEARDQAESGYRGLIVSQRFEVDGVQAEHMSTRSKIGAFPNGFRFAFIGSGIIIEPFSLAPGLHSARIVYSIDEDRDGNVDFEDPYSATFLINESPAQ